MLRKSSVYSFVSSFFMQQNIDCKFISKTNVTNFLEIRKLLHGIPQFYVEVLSAFNECKHVFFEPIGKTRWPPWPLIGWDIFDFFSETAEQNSTKLDRKQDLNPLYQVCVFRADPKNKMAALASDLLRHFRLLLWNPWTEFNDTWQEARSQRPLPSFLFFGPIGKTRWPPWPLIGWDIFDFFSETAEQNSTKLDRKQDLNPLYQVCVFRADPKNKMATLASDLLRHFRLLLWNPWTEFNDTWKEARSQRPLPSLCFSARSEKQDGRPGLWLAETFSTSPLKPLNRIQQNLIGSKISKPSTKFVFFGLIQKTRWPPRPLIGWDIFNFSVETAEWNSTNLDRKQDLNALYKVCVFRADRKNKMAALASDCRDIFDFSSETAEPNSMKLDRKQDLNALYQVCVFWADWKNKMAALASDLLRHFRLLLWNRWTGFSETWQEASSQCLLPHLCFSGKSGKNKMAALASDWLRHFQLLLWNCGRNSTKLDRKQDLNALYQVCVFSGGSEKQNCQPGLWFAETFSAFPLKPLNRIQQNLTGSKISTSSTRLAFFGLIRKTR